MKKLFLYLGVCTAIGVCFWSCEKDEKGTDGDIQITIESLDLSDEAVDTSFTFTSTADWSITTSEEWFSVSPTSGGAGEIQVLVSVEANTDAETGRQGSITIISGSRSTLIEVSQSQSVELKISNSNFSLTDKVAGATRIITITSSVRWSSEVVDEWLSISPRSGRAGKTSATITAKGNSSPGNRVGEIRIKTDFRTETIRVTQSKENRFIVSTEELFLSDKGGYRYIRISPSQPWTAAVDADWIQLEKTSGEIGSELIQVSAKSENTGGADREGNITITSAGESKTIRVIQGFVGNYYDDNDVIIVNKHTKGNGVPAVIVGDGFDREDLKKGGWWETWSRRLAEDHFLNVEVIKDLKDYLDVYILMSESQERGINAAPYKRTKTKFNASISENWSGAINAAISAVNRTRGETGAQEASWDNISVMFMANASYAGNASDPLSRMGIDEQSYDYWAVHEFAAHILTNVPDLYGGNGNGEAVTAQVKAKLDASHANGFEWFVDYHSDPNEVIWKDFIGAEGYANTYTGAPYYNESNNIGVYRTGYQANNYSNQLYGPSFKTAMREWYLCFDLGTRYQIWNMIMKLAGDNVNLNNLAAFKAYDKTRTPCDCRWSKYTGSLKGDTDGTPYKWTDYDASGKKIKQAENDRFWRALWPG